MLGGVGSIQSNRLTSTPGRTTSTRLSRPRSERAAAIARVGTQTRSAAARVARCASIQPSASACSGNDETS